MIFLWSTSDKPGAKLIRWGLNEPCSHFALCFFEHREKTSIVIESTLENGVQPRWLGDFLAVNRIVHALQFPQSSKEQAEIYHHVGGQLRGLEYDDWGILYWACAAFQRKYFGKRLPNKNEWGRNELVYCVEVLQAMGEFLLELGVDISKFDLEMTSPEMAFNILKQSIYLRDVTDLGLFTREAA